MALDSAIRTYAESVAREAPTDALVELRGIIDAELQRRLVSASASRAEGYEDTTL